MSIGLFSFFSGCGFLDLGFEASGFNVLYTSELSTAFTEAYSYSREQLGIPLPCYGCHSGEEGNIVEIVEGQGGKLLSDLVTDAKHHYDIIGFLGGSPCPDFSVGGKNRGKDGENGKLSSYYAELVCKHKPDFFLFENVKGLWRTKRHRDFYEELKLKFRSFGYVLTERLINSIEYGVPQDRDRIILLGFTSQLLQDLQIPLGIESDGYKSSFPWHKYLKYPKNLAFSYPWPQTNPFSENSLLDCPDDVPVELTAEFWFRQNDVFNHPNSIHFFKPRQGLKRFLTVDEGDDSKKSFKRLHRWRYSPTVCYGNNEVHLHPYKVRRLSVAEALSLQSLPKDFALPDSMSLSNMFKTIGNGVPYLAAKGIATTIFDFLHKSYSEIQSDNSEARIEQIELALFPN